MDFINREQTKLFKNNSTSPCLMLTSKMKKTDKEIFIKVFVDIKDKKSRLKLVDDFEYNEDLDDFYKKEEQYAGLIYETEIYNKKIQPMIDNKLSNNFINFICLYDINHEDLVKYILPETSFTINDDIKKALKLKLSEDFSGIQYKISIFDYKNNSRDLKSWMGNYLMVKDEDTEIDNCYYKDFWKVLFQIASACYLLSLSKIKHGDLHIENVIIETIPDEKTFVYIINNKRYTIKTKHIVYIYDFDRSYAKSLGQNKINSDDDKFDKENINIISFLCLFSNILKDTKLCEIFNILSSNKSSVHNLLKTTKNCYSDDLINDEYWYYNSEVIMNNIASFLDPGVSYTSPDQIYCFGNDMFDNDGNLKSERVLEIKSVDDDMENGIKKQSHSLHYRYNGKSCLDDEKTPSVLSFIDAEEDETMDNERYCEKSRSNSSENLLSISPISSLSANSFNDNSFDGLKRRSVKKRTVKRRSVKRRSAKRRSAKRRSAKRRSVKKRSAKKRSVKNK